MHWAGALYGIVLLACGLGTVISGAAHGAGQVSGLVAEDEFFATLAVWAIVWGSFAIATVVFFALDWWCRPSRGPVLGASVLGYVWGVLGFFAFVPWTVVGQVFLTRAFVSVGDTSGSVLFGFSAAALVVAYASQLFAVAVLADAIAENNRVTADLAASAVAAGDQRQSLRTYGTEYGRLDVKRL